jgi:glycosyltransferase involved in cell wall biosynthesis
MLIFWVGKNVILAAWHWGEISGTASVLENVVRHLEAARDLSFTLVVPGGRELAHVPPHIECRRLGDVSTGHRAWLEEFHRAFEGGDELLFFPGMQLPARIPRRFVSVLHDVLPLHSIDFRINPLRKCAYLSRIRAHAAAKRIVTVSQFSRNDITRRSGLSPDRFYVIPNGVEERFFSAKQTPLGAAEAMPYNDPYLLYVGDLTWRKNVAGLAKAYLMLPEVVRSRYRFVFTGQGAVRGQIERMFQRAGCSDRLTALGVVENRHLPPLLAGASLFVFPSLLEGFGLPVLEAQAAGVPVVCGNASSLPEVSGGAAYLVEAGSPRRLSGALAFLLTHEEERARLAEAGRRNAARYSWKTAARSYVQVFREALGST